MANKTHLDIDKQVARLVLSNIEIHNAFDDEIIKELRAHLANIRQNKQIRVLVIQAEGKHFCAGADLAWMKRMAQHTEAENLKDAKQLAGLMADIYNLPIPTIASVQGAAYGGAIGLIACCDIAIAQDNARFCLSEVKLGLAPATIGPYVVAAMGARRCGQLFMTAAVFNAEQALDYGLIHEIAVTGQLQDATNNTIAQLLTAGPEASKAAKHLIRQSIPPFDSKLSDTTSELIAKLRVSDEGQEGLHAFFEKRPAKWITK